jgi:hypothetical protein
LGLFFDKNSQLISRVPYRLYHCNALYISIGKKKNIYQKDD